jgi:hypothetical protein
MASIARLLQHASTVRVDEASAKEIGLFFAHLGLPETEKPDVVDAHVALVTRATQSLLWTSDPSDMARYGVETKFVRKL